jgi:hypothetical protein
MTALQFLAEWALRSAILILTGTVLLWALRVKDPSIRLLAWTATLCGSLAIPVLIPTLPGIPLVVQRLVTPPADVPVPVFPAPTGDNRVDIPQPVTKAFAPFHWQRALVVVYALVAIALLLRLCIGLAMSLRLRRTSRTTGQVTEGIDIRESDCLAAPVTLGIMHPAIVLPADWPQWSGAKLDAVLAHERSHIRRRDPAIQLFSAIHRALLWHSPVSWFLHKSIVRAAEEASDDAAVAAAGDRAFSH